MIFINLEVAKTKVRLQRNFDPIVRVLRLVQFAEVKVFVYGWSRFIALYQLFAAPAPTSYISTHFLPIIVGYKGYLKSNRNFIYLIWENKEKKNNEIMLRI